MPKHKRKIKFHSGVKLKKKPRVKNVIVAPGQILAVKIPPLHTPVVSTHASERLVEIVPIKKKKGWWESLLYGDD